MGRGTTNGRSTKAALLTRLGATGLVVACLWALRRSRKRRGGGGGSSSSNDAEKEAAENSAYCRHLGEAPAPPAPPPDKLNISEKSALGSERKQRRMRPPASPPPLALPSPGRSSAAKPPPSLHHSPLMARVDQPQSGVSTEPKERGSPGPRLEMVVHNVSHKDMVLRFSGTDPGAKDNLGRPKFSLFRPTSMRLKAQLDRFAVGKKGKVQEGGGGGGGGSEGAGACTSDAEMPAVRVAMCPLSNRRPVTPLFKPSPQPLPEKLDELPVGFDMRDCPISIQDLENYRFRRVESGNPVVSQVTAVYFPLLSLLVPKWKETILESGDLDCRKVIVLVTGVGTPRNPLHELEGNSTEVVALMMRDFLKCNHPDVEVVLLHSATNIYRFDENIRFVKRELLPLVEAERNCMARRCGESWRDMMHLTISFADGSPARISAINSSLRHFRPSFFHIWELKTFWHSGQLSEEDIEVHTFEDMETTPPVPLAEVDSLTLQLINRMADLRDYLSYVLLSDTPNDLKSFWLRKTGKPVLAVLLVQRAGCPPELYSGTNMEVSMPTGSLCAERNVIGSALSGDLSLRREDLKMVAVLGMTLDPVPTGGAAAAASLSSPSTLPANSSPPLNGRPLSSPQPCNHTLGTTARQRAESWAERSSPAKQRDSTDRSTSFDGHSHVKSEATSPARPGARKILVRSLLDGGGKAGQGGRGRVVQKVLKEPKSLNPLKPCGACMEWLKKIAEVNPDFKVVTFTDASCSGVFIESIAQLGI